MDEFVLYGGLGWGCILWLWKVAKSSLRLRKNDYRVCNKDYIFLLLFFYYLILYGYKIWMYVFLFLFFKNFYKWIL